jgi:gamma-glutamylcyclotransferase (GGCT)/AIG2-like uncharacterized protein YtfP
MSATASLFVYGTLMPGEERWHLLEPLTAAGAPRAATAAGLLYRTPYGWPAAVFGEGGGAVPGVAVVLADPGRALALLDEVEGVGAGLFERRRVATTAGRCLAYHWPGPTGGFAVIGRWAGGGAG